MKFQHNHLLVLLRQYGNYKDTIKMHVKFELAQMLHVLWDNKSAIRFLLLRQTCKKK